MQVRRQRSRAPNAVSAPVSRQCFPTLRAHRHDARVRKSVRTWLFASAMLAARRAKSPGTAASNWSRVSATCRATCDFQSLVCRRRLSAARLCAPRPRRKATLPLGAMSLTFAKIPASCRLLNVWSIAPGVSSRYALSSPLASQTGAPPPPGRVGRTRVSANAGADELLSEPDYHPGPAS